MDSHQNLQIENLKFSIFSNLQLVSSSTKPNFPTQCIEFFTPQIFSLAYQENKLENKLIENKEEKSSQQKQTKLDTQFKNIIYMKYEKLETFLENDLNFNFIRLNHNEKKILNRTGDNGTSHQKDFIFDSNFQSGNLLLVSQIAQAQYNLLIQNDINTIDYAEWFFFRVVSLKPRNKVIKLNILNFCSYKSLYKQGLKILVFSQNQQIVKKVGWHRSNANINYYKNKLFREIIKKQYYTLSFEYQITSYDQIYFAYNYPYTYSDLNKFLDKISIKQFSYFTRLRLCNSLLLNRIQCLFISQGDVLLKKNIYIIGRIHSGETISSYILENMIKILISNNQCAKYLRKRFNFIIIPMLNPDGVILGNHKCSAYGKDLNRQWTSPSAFNLPQIYFLKKLISKDENIEMIWDFHGNSRKKGVFVDSCHDHDNPFRTRIFPFILSQIYGSVFSYRDCNFNCGKQKNGTARKIIYQDKKCLYYTFYASSLGLKNQHYGMKTYQQLALKILEALQLYSQKQKFDKNYKRFSDKRLKYSKQFMINKLFENNMNYEIGLRNQYSDSDSDIDDKHIFHSKLMTTIELQSKLNKKYTIEESRTKEQSLIFTESLKDKKKSKSPTKKKNEQHQLDDLNTLIAKHIDNSLKVKQLFNKNPKLKSQNEKISQIINKCKSERKKLDSYQKLNFTKADENRKESIKQRIKTLISDTNLQPDISPKKMIQNQYRRHKRFQLNSAFFLKQE